MIRNFILMVGIFITLSLPSQVSAQKSEVEDWQIRTVKSLIDEKTHGYASGYGFKQNGRLGDSAAKILSKMVSEQETVSSENIEIYLSIIETAFVFPNGIDRPQDRKPRNSILFLNSLKTRTHDRQILNLIDDALKSIKRQNLKPLHNR